MLVHAGLRYRRTFTVYPYGHLTVYPYGDNNSSVFSSLAICRRGALDAVANPRFVGEM